MNAGSDKRYGDKNLTDPLLVKAATEQTTGGQLGANSSRAVCSMWNGEDSSGRVFADLNGFENTQNDSDQRRLSWKDLCQDCFDKGAGLPSFGSRVNGIEKDEVLLDENGAISGQQGAKFVPKDDRKTSTLPLQSNVASSLESPVDVTFQAMQYRKLLRKIHGTYESDQPWTMVWIFLTLLLFFGVAGANFHEGHFEIKLTSGLLGFVSLATALTFLILVYTLTRLMFVFRWMLYWILLGLVLNLLITRNYNFFTSKTPKWLIVALSLFEFFTVAIYFLHRYAYPRILSSDFFRKALGAKNFWEVRVIGPWTLTYSSGFPYSVRHTCSYRGQTNNAGLPHGYGHWMDDSYHGEILTGWWENGMPVGPFRSREYGSGHGFEKVMIGFVMATDDNITGYKFNPTNNLPPRCGVASVECSVAGGFFSHLPSSTVVFGPFELRGGAEDFGSPASPRDLEIGGSTMCIEGEFLATIANCLARLRYLSHAHPLSSLVIDAKLGSGVSVPGHVYEPTGKCTSQRCRQLIIDVVYPEDEIRNESQGPDSMEGEMIEDGRSNRNRSHTHFTVASPTTSALHSSMQFAELDSSMCEVDGDSDDEDLETRGDVNNIFGVDSDMESVDLDGSALLRQFSFGGKAHPRKFLGATTGRSLANKSEESVFESDSYTTFYPSNSAFVQPSYNSGDHRMLLETALQAQSEQARSGPIQNGFDGVNGHFQPVDPSSSAMPHLRVRNWRSTIQGHQEALIFIPGFNCSVSDSLERFGQFLTICHLPPYIKPFLFSWPAGQVATYFRSMSMAADNKTIEAFGAMLDGLYDAGIRDVHIITHSMGVQMLLAAFQDKPLGERSNVSMRFSSAPDFLEETRPTGSGDPLNSSLNGLDDSTVYSSNSNLFTSFGVCTLLRCRTITLLNADFPLAAFVDHAFMTIRRVCNHITVVGNRKDQALWWSELGNGCMETIDYYLGFKSRPDHLKVNIMLAPKTTSGRSDLDSCIPKISSCCGGAEDAYEKVHGQDRLFSKQLTVGKNIMRLYASTLQTSPQLVKNLQKEFRATRSFFQRIRGTKKRKKLQRLPWFDLDAIDTTWMEANVHALRHNYFNLNRVLIEDLHELIVTGRRAFERTNLLHREGNIYSYCQAPECVVNES